MEISGIRRAEDRVMVGLVAGLLNGTVVHFAARFHLTHEAMHRTLRTLVKQGRGTNQSREAYQLHQ